MRVWKQSSPRSPLVFTETVSKVQFRNKESQLNNHDDTQEGNKNKDRNENLKMEKVLLPYIS